MTCVDEWKLWARRYPNRFGIFVEGSEHEPVFNKGDVVIVVPGREPEQDEVCFVMDATAARFRVFEGSDERETKFGFVNDPHRFEIIGSACPSKPRIIGTAIGVLKGEEIQFLETEVENILLQYFQRKLQSADRVLSAG